MLDGRHRPHSCGNYGTVACWARSTHARDAHCPALFGGKRHLTVEEGGDRMDGPITGGSGPAGEPHTALRWP